MVLVEGAGGVRVPLNESDTMLDLITALDFPVLLVAEAGLGTINHALLSIEALRAARVRILGVVLNNIHECRDDDAFIRTDNPKAIERFGQVNVLGSLRYVLNVTPRSQVFVTAFEQDLANLIGVVEQELRSYDRQIDPA
jgi:dethiobiotin synthetase